MTAVSSAARAALVVGASSGIGAVVAGRLAAAGWRVVGMARRPGTVAAPGYRHVIADAADLPAFRAALAAEAADVELAIYAAGIGRELDLATFAGEVDTFAVNLLGAVACAEIVIPRMLARGRGHFVGLSSQADRYRDDRAPGYAASKAGMSAYLENLALACRPRGVAITNVRFGFVDTAMSREARVRPFLMTAERAADHVERALARRPIRYTAPRRMALALWLANLPRRFRAAWT